MTNTNEYEDFQKELLYVEDDIEIGLFTIYFKNEELEEKFQAYVKKNNFNLSIFFFLILGVYYALYIYHGMMSYKHVSSYTGAVGVVLFVSIIHICLYYYCDNISFKNLHLYLIHIIFQFYHINHIFKAYFYLNENKYEEIVRLFYAYMIINIAFYLLVIPLSRFHYYFTQMVVILVPILYINIKSDLGAKFIPEYCILLFSLIIHELKKKNEISTRISFLEYSNRKRIFQYYKEFKNLSDNKNLTLNNQKKTVYANSQFNVLLDEFIKEKQDKKDNINKGNNVDVNVNSNQIHNEIQQNNNNSNNNICKIDNVEEFLINLKSETIIEKYKKHENSTLFNIIDDILSSSNETSFPYKIENFGEKIGVFSFTSSSINDTKFYEISIKFFIIDKNKYLLDILMNDITNIKKSERTNAEEKIKHKILSKIAHEFKTPLIMIINQLNDLNDLPSMKNNFEVKELCNQNIKLSEYMTFLINDIIYYVSDMKASVQMKEIDVLDALNFSYQILRTFIKTYKKNVLAKIIIDDNITDFSIFSDDLRLKQLLLNFISNAAKFTKEGMITINAYIRKIDTIYDLVIEVLDTGMGIKQEDLELIRSNNDKNIILSLDKNYNRMGTGIGLNICKSVISLLDNHSFEIESNIGVGTRISVIIRDLPKKNTRKLSQQSEKHIRSSLRLLSPLKVNSKSIKFISPKEDKDKENKDINELKDSIITKNIKKSSFYMFNYFDLDIDENSNIINDLNISSFKFNNRKFQIENFSLQMNYNPLDDEYKHLIIVCDDNDIIRKSMSKIISTTIPNSKIIECFDGIDALTKIIHYRKVDLLFIDENMEYMQGSTCLKLTKELMEDNKINTIKMISCTAFEDEETKFKIMGSGAKAILSKPISKKELEKCLSEIDFIVK